MSALGLLSLFAGRAGSVHETPEAADAELFAPTHFEGLERIGPGNPAFGFWRGHTMKLEPGDTVSAHGSGETLPARHNEAAEVSSEIRPDPVTGEPPTDVADGPLDESDPLAAEDAALAAEGEDATTDPLADDGDDDDPEDDPITGPEQTSIHDARKKPKKASKKK